MTGLNEGIYMMSAYRDEPVYGKVWPGAATFIDWFHPNATDYWVNQFEQFYKILPIDGVWLDMNEVSNSCNGECWHYPALNFTNMAFTPGGVDLNQKTMDILAKHYTSDPSLQGLYIEYNIHSTYGFLESKATNQWLTQER